MAKSTQVRNAKLTIESVKNGYIVKIPGGNMSGYIITSSDGSWIPTGDSAGEYVFADFAGLSTFLRNNLVVPAL